MMTLRDESQKVMLDGVSSDFKLFTLVSPREQRSLHGPLMFLIYINEVQTEHTSSSR